MTTLGFMTIITVFVVTLLVVRILVLKFLVWMKPNGYLELSYTDKAGVTHKRKVRLGKGSDHKELLEILREIKSTPEAKAR